MSIYSKAVKEFVGPEALLPSAPFKLAKLGKSTQTAGLPGHFHEIRRIEVTPKIAAACWASNEYYLEQEEWVPNRIIGTPRLGELSLLSQRMEADLFVPSQASIAVTTDGRLVEGQGRLLCQMKTGKTYTYTVDVINSGQRDVLQYSNGTRGTTAPVTLSQQWVIGFGLLPKVALMAQQIFNGLEWHDEGILGSTTRTPTKTALCNTMSLPKDLKTVAELYASRKIPKNVNSAALATIELLASRSGINSQKIEDFREGVLTGDNLRAKDPRKVLRENLMSRAKGRTVRFQEQVSYIKYSFDKFISGSDQHSFRGAGVVTFNLRDE